MPIIPKYRPSLTADEIDAIIYALENLGNPEPTPNAINNISALKNLKLFKMKIDMDMKTPAHVTTGGKTGRPSALDIIKDEPVKEISEHEAKTQIQLYKDLGMPIPEELKKYETQ